MCGEQKLLPTDKYKGTIRLTPNNYTKLSEMIAEIFQQEELSENDQTTILTTLSTFHPGSFRSNFLSFTRNQYDGHIVCWLFLNLVNQITSGKDVSNHKETLFEFIKNFQKDYPLTTFGILSLGSPYSLVDQFLNQLATIPSVNNTDIEEIFALATVLEYADAKHLHNKNHAVDCYGDTPAEYLKNKLQAMKPHRIHYGSGRISITKSPKILLPLAERRDAEAKKALHIKQIQQNECRFESIECLTKKVIQLLVEQSTTNQ